MPSLGSDMEAGTLVEWLVKPGDSVKRGDVVAVVETQKGAIEIEIFEPGRVEQLLVEIGRKVPVGTPLARLAGADGAAPAQPAWVASVQPSMQPSLQTSLQPTMQPVPPAPAAAAPLSAPTAAPLSAPTAERVSAPLAPARAAAVPAGRLRASPAARRLAQAKRIDLAGIRGSGPEGAIVLADIERASAAAPAPEQKKRAAGLDLDAMRVAIAAAMARSKREIPHYYLEHPVDLTQAEQWLARTNAALAPDRRLLMGALAIKAVALAARRYPALNGFYRDGRFEPAASVHIGTAIAIRGGGLAAPAILDADRLALDELMARMRDLVQRTRAGHLRSSELADATLTVSSLGERGVETLYGIIYPPQVAIVGIGKMTLRPWVVEGAIAPRPAVTLTLAADHRVSDGHAGALFLAEIGKLLQEPDKL